MKKVKAFLASISLFFIPVLVKAQTGTSGQGWDTSSLTSFGLSSSSVSDIVRNVLTWILGIFGLLAVIGFVVSGIMYIISSGNDDTMKKAKNAMVYCIIGVIVALSGLIIIFAVDKALRGTSQF